ncbi:MAG: methylmalonyl-CoA mutase family protein, partial [Chloroflexota bacterium]|nr:methylmalonyl-CoA mutase family protein [Chloroflexota bacterium]
YYIEWLTDRIEEGARDYLRRIAEMGGTLRAIEEGFQQSEIQEAAYRWQNEVDSGERVIVGVNRYRSEEADAPEIHRVDPALQTRQVERLQTLREERNEATVAAALERLRNAAEESQNLMPFIIDCVQSLVTLGEISDAFRTVFGEYKERRLI